MRIGHKLIKLRKQVGYSQRELAKKSGVSPGFISQIEQDKSSITIASLKKILTALNTDLGIFFADDGKMKDNIVFRKEEMVDIAGQAGGIQYFSITPNTTGKRIQMLFEVYKPGTDTGSNMLKHDAEEIGIIIQGEIELTVGKQKYLLKEGDGYYFNSRLPHRFRNCGKGKTVLVSANTPPSF